jgi:hypothetical protein
VIDFCVEFVFEPALAHASQYPEVFDSDCMQFFLTEMRLVPSIPCSADDFARRYSAAASRCDKFVGIFLGIDLSQEKDEGIRQILMTPLESFEVVSLALISFFMFRTPLFLEIPVCWNCVILLWVLYRISFVCTIYTKNIIFSENSSRMDQLWSRWARIACSASFSSFSHIQRQDNRLDGCRCLFQGPRQV